MKKVVISLVAGFFLMLCQRGISQSISNTDNVITLTGTCIGAGMTSSTYDLVLNYAFDDTYTKSISGVAVNISGNVMTIAGPANSFPSPTNNGYWSLSDSYNGTISLTAGGVTHFMTWYLKDDLTDGFNCGALPVSISSFTGSQSSSPVHTVDLNWTTEDEQNTTFIEIYRSSTAPGSSFYKIGQVTAAGNSIGSRSYPFHDPNPGPDNLYQLKILTSNGTPALTSPALRQQCSGCSYTPAAPVNCPFTINGPDHICSLEDPHLYALSSAVPDYSTIVWSVDQPSQVHLTTFPAFDRTKVSLQRKDAAAGITLTATLSGCTNSIVKYVALSTPDPAINVSINCPFLHADAVGAAGATNYEWHVVDATTGAEHVANTPSSSWSANIINGDVYNIWFVYTNGCGTSNPAGADGNQCGFSLPPDPLSALAISPNPSTGMVSVSLAAAPMVSNKLTVPVGKPKIYQLRLVDGQGVIRKTFKYAGEDNVSVNLSGLTSGIYTVQVFDNKTWRSGKVVLIK